MQRRIVFAGLVVAAATFAGTAAGIGFGLSLAPSPVSTAEAAPPVDTYFDDLLRKVETIGSDAGAKAACGIRETAEADPYEALVKPAVQSGRISIDQFAKLDLAYFGAEYRESKFPCRLSGASAAG